MAAKVNTRFILGLVLALGVALALLGGVYVLKMRGDATRNSRRGSESMAKGDYKAAFDQFGRALAKEPANPEHIARMREALDKIIPQTASEAGEYFTRVISLYGHTALYNPKDVNAHLALLHQLTSTARRTGNVRGWDSILAAADSMHLNLDAGEPLRPLAKVYRALAISRLASTTSDELIEQAISELDQAAALLPENDLASATQITLRAAWLEKNQTAGRSKTTLDGIAADIDRVAEASFARNPTSPETARAYLLQLIVKKIANNDAVTNEQLAAAADRLAAAINPITPATDPSLIAEASRLFAVNPSTGAQQARHVLEQFLAANPTAFDHQMLLANMQFERGELDAAETSARTIIEAKPLSAGLMAQMLFGLRMQAASLLGDIQFRRLEQTPAAADRPAGIQALIEARNVLAGLSANPETDPIVTRADAKIAFAKGEFVTASQKFESLVQATSERDPEMLAFASMSLRQIGQLGLALERVSSAVSLNPQASNWIASKAELELRMGQIDQAGRTIQLLSDQATREPRISQIVNAVKTVMAGGSAPATDDPVQAAINAAQEALKKNESETARAVLLAALNDHPDAMPLVQSLALVEFRSGNREAAQGYVERGMKIQSGDATLNQIAAALRFEDPIDATIEYLRTMVADEKARLSNTLVSMTNIAAQQRQRTSQLKGRGDSADAAKAQAMLDRAETEALNAATALQAVEPENPQMIEYFFGRALESKDWKKAEELAAEAKRLNIDAAGGLIFDGRLKLAQNNPRDAIASLEAATDRLSFSSQAWRMLAIAYQGAGNFAEAERAYQQAYRCNPNDISGVRAYLTLLQQRGDLPRALEILRNVHRLAPGDTSFREAWLELEFAVGDKALGLRERLSLYAANKADRENASALARMLATTDPTQDLVLDESGQPAYSQQRWAAMSLSQQEEIQRGTRERWSALADEIVAGLEAAQGDELRVAVLRATILRARGDLPGGEAILREFITRREKAAVTEDMYIELSRYQAAIDRYSDAVESLRQAVSIAGPKQRDAEVALGVLHMQLQQYKDALEVFESAQKRVDDQRTRLQIIECLINLGRMDDAERMLADSASGEGGSVVTLLSASIARKRGDALVAQQNSAAAERFYIQQRDLLAKAEQQDPTNPLPRILLAESLIEEYNRTQRSALLDDAMVALERADQIRAGLPQVSAMRVAIQRERGDTSTAVAELQRSIDANPNNANARRQLVQLLAESGNVAAAIAVVDAAIRINSTNASWHEMRGDLVGDGGRDVAQAVASYALAYEHAPSTAMLRKLTAAMLLMSPPDCQGTIARIEARQDALAIEPALRDAYARALVCVGRRDSAIEQLRLSFATHKERRERGEEGAEAITSWFIALATVFPPNQVADAEKFVNNLAAGSLQPMELSGVARLWLTTGGAGLNRAMELLRQAIAQCPPDQPTMLATLSTDLGDLLVGSGDIPGATAAYETAIKQNPSQWVALNNLAYLKAEVTGDPPGALVLAEKLIQGGQRQGGVLDTVGWVYYKNGDLVNAKRYLSESVAILPAPDTYVHLAEVLWKSGDSSAALAQLQDAEKLNPLPETQQRIKSLRDDIGSSR